VSVGYLPSGAHDVDYAYTLREPWPFTWTPPVGQGQGVLDRDQLPEHHPIRLRWRPSWPRCVWCRADIDLVLTTEDRELGSVWIELGPLDGRTLWQVLAEAYP
jgi:hypothetical protein